MKSKLTEVATEDPEEHFQQFFKQEKYRENLSQMAIEGERGICVEFEELLIFDTTLTRQLLGDPDKYIKHMENAALTQLRIEDPEYAETIEGVNVRLRNLPETTPLRTLSSKHIGKLIMVNGIVVRSTPIKPMILKAAFKCMRCGTVTTVEQTGVFLKEPTSCASPACGRRGPFTFIEKRSEYTDFQEVRIQERPEELPPGQLPRSLLIKLVGEGLVDVARPGDDISVVGVVRTSSSRVPKAGQLRVLNVYLGANSIEVKSKTPEATLLTPEEEAKIRGLAKDPLIHKKIINSIAPSIYGYDHIKEAVMYLLFGGIPKQLPDIKIRGEINVLLVGDPGTAKSRLLMCVSEISPRGLYTSGRGTTAAGLTAAVLREKSGGMVLEAGALVLADKGVCCIDEIDKMRPEDRVAIHEALATHTVSIAKGGIVATLNARCAALAAANPALGRYDPYKSISENLNLPVTLLSRFDLIFLLRDVPEKERDKKLSEHILTVHMKRAVPTEPPIPPDLLKKYIAYARSTIEPTLASEALKRIQDFYLSMRSASIGDESSPIVATPRQLESLVRLTEARARAALRNEVLPEDVEAAITLMTRSLQEVGIDVATNRMDIDTILTGKPKSMRDKMGTILSTVIEMQKETGMVEKDDLLRELNTKHNISIVETAGLVAKLTREGTLFVPKDGFIKKT